MQETFKEYVSLKKILFQIEFPWKLNRVQNYFILYLLSYKENFFFLDDIMIF